MKKKLLLADDSITIQKVIAITFSSDDYALTVVDNGDAALDKARSERPDLIMADVFMPGKNGYEVCAAVKSDPTLQGVPVLLLTGTFEPFDEAKAREAGADKWIAKPFESQSLIDCVEKLLAQAAIAPAAPAPVAQPQPPAPPAQPRPLPGAPVAPQPQATAASAPGSRPLPGVVPTPPVAPAVAPSVTAAPVAAPSGPTDDDIWGSADIAASFGELPAMEEPQAVTMPQAEMAEEDLWGTVSFEEELPEGGGTIELETTAADVWGGIEEDFAAPSFAPVEVAAPAPAPAVDDSIWGNMEADLGAAQPEPSIDLEAAAWQDEDEILPLGDVEILEEVDLAPPAPTVDIFATSDATTIGFADESALELAAFDEAAPVVAPDAAPAWAASEFEVMELEASEMSETFADAAAAPIKPVSAAVITPEPAVEQQVAALSEEQLEAIVERVAGAVIERLAGTVLERIVWEVVPDLAEAIVREEIRKIKEAV